MGRGQEAKSSWFQPDMSKDEDNDLLQPSERRNPVVFVGEQGRFSTEDLWLNDVITRINSINGKPEAMLNEIMPVEEVSEILKKAKDIFIKESNLLEVEVPVKVLGDIHGQFQDMQKLFDIIGRVPNERMLFLGDYVDRGEQGIETVVLLLAQKVRYPQRIFLLRGNHETPSVNKVYGFEEECTSKYDSNLWCDFQGVFNWIPMAALVGKKILCMHGGLSPNLTSLDDIRKIERPCDIEQPGIALDILWSDPTNHGVGWFESNRGVGYLFGKDVVNAACKLFAIDLIIRAHQVVQDGYEIMDGRRVVTVFSAPNYCGQFDNAAAVVCIDSDLTISFQQMRAERPNHELTEYPETGKATNPQTFQEDQKSLKPFTGFKQQQQ